MKEKENISYLKIMDHIKNNPNMPQKQKKDLISYAFKLKINNIENINNESIENIKDALNILITESSKFENTSIATQRYKTIQLLSQQLKKENITPKELKKISFKIDMLFMRLDLPMRKNSGLAYNLTSKENHHAKK